MEGWVGVTHPRPWEQEVEPGELSHGEPAFEVECVELAGHVV